MEGWVETAWPTMAHGMANHVAHDGAETRRDTQRQLRRETTTHPRQQRQQRQQRRIRRLLLSQETRLVRHEVENLRPGLQG